jgi:hypothetical protein
LNDLLSFAQHGHKLIGIPNCTRNLFPEIGALDRFQDIPYVSNQTEEEPVNTNTTNTTDPNTENPIDTQEENSTSKANTTLPRTEEPIKTEETMKPSSWDQVKSIGGVMAVLIGLALLFCLIYHKCIKSGAQEPSSPANKSIELPEQRQERKVEAAGLIPDGITPGGPKKYTYQPSNKSDDLE